MSKSHNPGFSKWGARLPLILILLIFFALGVLGTAAQEATADPNQPLVETTAPPVAPAQAPATMTITSAEPKQITRGQAVNLSVIGTNFTDKTVVRLNGYGFLTTTFINPTAVVAAVPNTVPSGIYNVDVTDPVNFPNDPTLPPVTFTVVDPPPAPTERPAPTEVIIPTAVPIPTDIPGAPNLLVRSFSANPGSIKPGDTVTFTVEIVNQGTRTAQGISLTVDAGGKFIAANGQAAVLMPDMAVNTSYVVSVPVIAASDTPGGPQTVAITLSYRDFTGATYSSKGSLTIDVKAVSSSSQVTMARYLVDPNPVIPGKPVKVTILLTNSGNETAGQVLLQIGDGILLAGPQGNSFPVGDMQPGSSQSLELPLIVSTGAKAGPQSQAITINYLQNGESKSSNSSMTIDVANVVAPAPLLQLDTYDYGKDILLPGDRFTLTLVLKNIGDADANNMLVTFGTVDSTGTQATPDGSGSSTTTTPSSTFAPLGNGGTLFAGTLKAGKDSTTLTQEFIVSGSVDSGIYSLPVTLRYTKDDGSTAQDSLRASIVVLVPPNLLINDTAPLAASVNIGEPVYLSLEISNKGRKQVNFSNVVVTAENADVQDGADTYLGPLRVDDETTVSASVIPSAVGKVKINVTFNYIDDLNQANTLVKEYEVEAVEPPPPVDNGEPPPDFNMPTPTPTPTDPNEIIGRALFGLLGLGS
jgi:uncharacterized repeat protein (TIGR01451 family)